MTKTNDTSDNTQITHTIIKTASCPTLSEKSTLNYHISSQGKEISFRIDSNDGGGFFSREWISFADIQKVLTEWPKKQPITSMVFRGLFKGKSVNSSAFLLAALKKLIATKAE